MIFPSTHGAMICCGHRVIHKICHACYFSTTEAPCVYYSPINKKHFYIFIIRYAVDDLSSKTNRRRSDRPIIAFQFESGVSLFKKKSIDRWFQQQIRYYFTGSYFHRRVYRSLNGFIVHGWLRVGFQTTLLVIQKHTICKIF